MLPGATNRARTSISIQSMPVSASALKRNPCVVSFVAGKVVRLSKSAEEEYRTELPLLSNTPSTATRPSESRATNCKSLTAVGSGAARCAILASKPSPPLRVNFWTQTSPVCMNGPAAPLPFHGFSIKFSRGSRPACRCSSQCAGVSLANRYAS